MSRPYAEVGRTDQKRRTLDALVAAARQLVAAGASPTVDDAALMAGVARSTAYRYFPGQRELLSAAHPETARASLLPEDPPADVAERLDAVVIEFTRMILETEAQHRTMLRLSLEQPGEGRRDLPLRQGRAISWLTEALAPLQGEWDGQDIHRLVLAIRSATGIESLVWLTDIGGLSREEAVASMRWTAGALLKQAMRDRSSGGGLTSAGAGKGNAAPTPASTQSSQAGASPKGSDGTSGPRGSGGQPTPGSTGLGGPGGATGTATAGTAGAGAGAGATAGAATGASGAAAVGPAGMAVAAGAHVASKTSQAIAKTAQDSTGEGPSGSN